MQIITNLNQLNALTPSPLRDHLTRKFHDLVETEDDLPPIFIIAEPSDDITGPNYAFVSSNGLLGDDDGIDPYESITHLPDLNMFELLYLAHGEDAYWIYVPTPLVNCNLALKQLLKSTSPNS